MYGKFTYKLNYEETNATVQGLSLKYLILTGIELETLRFIQTVLVCPNNQAT